MTVVEADNLARPAHVFSHFEKDNLVACVRHLVADPSMCPYVWSSVYPGEKLSVHFLLMVLSLPCLVVSGLVALFCNTIRCLYYVFLTVRILTRCFWLVVVVLSLCSVNVILGRQAKGVLPHLLNFFTNKI